MKKHNNIMIIFGIFTITGCQTAHTAHSGFLKSYDGAAPQKGNLRAAINQKRNDNASDAIERVFIQPTILASNTGLDLTEEEKGTILKEVDRQICFEISKRFTIAYNQDPNTALIRTSIVRIDTTGRAGSVASAAGKFFNPIPILEVRVPGSLGGIAIESEMLSPDLNDQIAFITWSRDAKMLGTEAPSLSRIGDALQLAEPMGDAIAAAFASKNRKVKKINKPDPCQQYGSRNMLTTGAIIGAASGLYIPKKDDATNDNK